MKENKMSKQYLLLEVEQPLNEAYDNNLLEAYQKISDTFDDFTQLMRSRTPYESCPEHCKIARVSEDLMGCIPKEEIMSLGPLFIDLLKEKK